MARTFLLMCLCLLFACSSKSEKIPRSPAKQANHMHSSELRFDATAQYPALSITVEWRGSVAAPDVVPVVSQVTYQMATQCLGKKEWENKKEYTLKIDLARMEVRCSGDVSKEVNACLRGRAQAIRAPLESLKIDFLAVSMGSGVGKR